MKNLQRHLDKMDDLCLKFYKIYIYFNKYIKLPINIIINKKIIN